MPRVNRHGEAAFTFVANARGGCWLNDETALFQQPVIPGTETDPTAKWQMVTRPRGAVGRGTHIAGTVDGGAPVAAGGDRWMRRFDWHHPPMSGSEPWSPADGRVGDIDRDGNALMLSEDALTMFFGRTPVRRDDVQGNTRYMNGLACWTSRGSVRVYDAYLGKEHLVMQVGPGAAKALAVRDASGAIWVLYQTDEHGGVCHHLADARTGYRYGESLHIYDPDVLVTGQQCAIYWARLEGQEAEDLRQVIIPVLGSNMVPLTAIVQPPAPPPVPIPPTTPEPLAITIDAYGEYSRAPWRVWATYRVSGHGGQPVRVWLTLDGQRVSGSDAAEGRIECEAHEPGEYRIGATVTCGTRQSQTGAVRIVRLLPGPPPEPIKTGRDGYVQAAEEARRVLTGEDTDD